jgi:hypothetical protein
MQMECGFGRGKGQKLIGDSARKALFCMNGVQCFRRASSVAAVPLRKQ